MFYKKEGYPENSDIVLCTVKKILYHSVFVTLDEYKDKEGMIHISEISPGRIRNINDFVREGKKIICKTLSVSIEKNHIDLSLRRVSNSERINKNAEYKQEQKAEKLLEQVGIKLKVTIEDMYKKIGYKLIEDYESLNTAFQNISLDHSQLKEYKLDKKLEEALLNLIKEKIKPPEVKIAATLTIINTKPNGIEIIKEILLTLESKGVNITYVGAPNYRVVIKDTNYKSAESKLKEISESVNLLLKQKGCQGEIVKESK